MDKKSGKQRLLYCIKVNQKRIKFNSVFYRTLHCKLKEFRKLKAEEWKVLTHASINYKKLITYIYIR